MSEILEVVVEEHRRGNRVEEFTRPEPLFAQRLVRCMGTNRDGDACGHRVKVIERVSDGIGELPVCRKHSDLTDAQMKGLKAIRREYRQKERELRKLDR